MSIKIKEKIIEARKAGRALAEKLRLASIERDQMSQRALVKECAADANALAKALGYKAPAKKKAPAKAKK